MKKRIMFYCQHVLGMGHLIRSAEIARGLAAAGNEVCFLNGGEIVEGFEIPASIRVINLPPIKSDAEFRDIQATNEAVGLEEVRKQRKQILLEQYHKQRPDVLMIEMFPFGRRKFSFELMPLLQAIQADGGVTKVVCSLRDILVSKRDQMRFENQTIALMNQYFDLLLVHADAQFQRLEETFPRLSEIACPINYTGFVTQPLQGRSQINRPPEQPPNEVSIIASIGGGRVGAELLECTLEASALLAGHLPHQLQIFTGPYCPDEQFTMLHQQAAAMPQVRLERYSTEFVAELERADLSISMAGYNTCMNILTTGIRAIVYPFTGNNNEEQTIRAEKLQELGIVSMIRRNELQPERMAHLIKQSLEKSKASQSLLNLEGAAQTARCLEAFLNTPFRSQFHHAKNFRSVETCAEQTGSAAA